MTANRTAVSMYVEWKRLQRTGLRRLQESYVPLYERTRHFRVYSSRVVPGVLQTEEYARALLANIAAFRGCPTIRPRPRRRVARSHVVREGGRRFALIMEEDVLHFRYGGAVAMSTQLAHLLAVMALPSVSLGVIPRTATRGMWGQETFTMFDDERVHVELLTAKVTVTQPSEIATYARAFAELAKMAVYGDDARALVRAAIGTLQ